MAILRLEQNSDNLDMRLVIYLQTERNNTEIQKKCMEERKLNNISVLASRINKCLV